MAVEFCRPCKCYHHYKDACPKKLATFRTDLAACRGKLERLEGAHNEALERIHNELIPELARVQARLEVCEKERDETEATLEDIGRSAEHWYHAAHGDSPQRDCVHCRLEVCRNETIDKVTTKLLDLHDGMFHGPRRDLVLQCIAITETFRNPPDSSIHHTKSCYSRSHPLECDCRLREAIKNPPDPATAERQVEENLQIKPPLDNEIITPQKNQTHPGTICKNCGWRREQHNIDDLPKPQTTALNYVSCNVFERKNLEE